MIANIYLTKAALTPHLVHSMLTRNGMITTITFTDLDISVSVIDINTRMNNIKININTSKEWDKLSNYLLQF